MICIEWDRRVTMVKWLDTYRRYAHITAESSAAVSGRCVLARVNPQVWETYPYLLVTSSRVHSRVWG